MKARHFLFVSRGGSSSGLAWRIRQEGHGVKMFIEQEPQRDVGDDFFEKTEDWRAEVDWADVVIFDSTRGHGALAEELRRQGKPVIGGSAWTDRLEDDPAFGQAELRQAGSPSTPHWHFDFVEDAVRHIQENPGPWVLRLLGKASSDEPLVFVSRHPEGEDALEALPRYQAALGPALGGIHLQERIEGIEVGAGGFFDGRDFVRPLPLVFEAKRLFSGDAGPLTAGMGACLLWGPPTPVFERTVAPLRDALAREGYRGFIAVTCLVNGDGIHPIEFTCRFGGPALGALLNSLAVPVGDFFAGLARGEAPELRIEKPFQIGARVVMPPYPGHDEKTFLAFSKGAAIDLFDTGPQIYIEDLKRLDGRWRVAGSSGAILTAAGAGRTPQSARRELGRILERLRARNDNLAYRNDIGARWPQDLDRLREWGYLGDSGL
jgi:phosphoribosylamine--glycine ligase